MRDWKIYTGQSPFPYAVIDSFLPQGAFDYVSASTHLLPFMRHWYEYDNPFEKKYALNRRDLMPPLILAFIEVMEGYKMCRMMAKLMDEEGRLWPDKNLNGAGIHRIPRGGFLDIHTDHNHSESMEGFERRLNAIFFIHEEWDPAWGGNLELWEGKGLPQKRVKQFIPKPNRLILFEAGDNSFHGHPTPLECPTDKYRTSIALYYYSKVMKDKEDRVKVRFVPLPDEEYDPHKSALREMRSNPEHAESVYRSE